MGQVNIYKISENKRDALVRELEEKLQEVGTQEVIRDISSDNLEALHEVESDDKDNPDEDKDSFEFTLYMSIPQAEKDVSWSWLLNAFNLEVRTTLPNPKSVLLIQHGNELYGITFGFAYFLVDKYCDRNFAFNFARKLKYKEVRTTALTTPNSQKNKSINTC